ncbi:hypothetical protein Sme01_06510 [Sphaerisporangium melleum]|uniref:Regulator of SigK n=1 Tax=Sphaerisporangium melleum TaxID=321316 RepID=A0A917VU40_9ACTN|nr:anti-sigma factor [Sphaerisporangium melleum]GGL14279.1 hypothetical protein GCM10007964_65360 [Sphaerisporangium melleum]GII68175.1 hypothetical protein Sme01_06510 [Sphaerisporangium melleum]
MNPDPHTLAGAYALNAIDDERERRGFEEHLAECAECAAELVTFTETAARLGEAAAVAPPPEMRSRVMASIEQVRRLPPETPEPAGRERRGGRRRQTNRPPADPRAEAVRPADPWAATGRRADSRSAARRPSGRRPAGRRPWLAVVTAAATVAVVVLGIATVRLQSSLDQVRRAGEQVSAVLAAPDARLATATGKNGRGTVVLSRSRGGMVFLASGLAPLPGDRTYQLWQIAPDRIRSAGLLSTDPTGATPPTVTTPTPGATKLGVTVEPAGGSSQPTTKPLLLVTLPTT